MGKKKSFSLNIDRNQLTIGSFFSQAPVNPVLDSSRSQPVLKPLLTGRSSKKILRTKSKQEAVEDFLHEQEIPGSSAQHSLASFPGVPVVSLFTRFDTRNARKSKIEKDSLEYPQVHSRKRKWDSTSNVHPSTRSRNERKPEATANSNINEVLDIDSLMHTFTYLVMQRAVCEKVCKLWLDVLGRSMFWKQKFLKDFSCVKCEIDSLPSTFNWRALYFRCVDVFCSGTLLCPFCSVSNTQVIKLHQHSKAVEVRCVGKDCSFQILGAYVRHCSRCKTGRIMVDSDFVTWHQRHSVGWPHFSTGCCRCSGQLWCKACRGRLFYCNRCAQHVCMFHWDLSVKMCTRCFQQDKEKRKYVRVWQLTHSIDAEDN